MTQSTVHPKPRWRGKLALLLSFAGAISLMPAQAQEPGSLPEVILTTDVSRVEVPVRVTGKGGKPVRDLRKEDFVLFDEGKQQVILSADYRGKPEPAGVVPEPRSESKPSSETVPPPATVSATDSPQQLTIVCFDAVHTSTASLGRARDALKKLFRSSSGELANPVVLISLNPELRVLQSSTNRSELLLKALDGPGISAAMGNPARTNFYATVESLKARFERYCNSCPCVHPSRSLGSDCATQQRTIRETIDAQAERHAQASSTLLDSFEAVIREAAKLPGNKTVALVSDGFALRPGSDFYSIALSYVPESPIFALASPRDINEKVTLIGRLAADNQIPINTVHPLGVYSPSFLQGGVNDVSSSQMGTSSASNRGGTLYMEAASRARTQLWNNEAPLAAMAALSVGAYLHSDNDLRAMLQTAVDPFPDYYVLSYSPSAPGDHKHHDLKVKMVNHDYHVEYRKGYSAE
jgi:VWFA-related protein